MVKNPSPDSKRDEMNQRIKALEKRTSWSTLFSALTLCCAIIGLIFRFQPIIQVANPLKVMDQDGLLDQ